MPSGLTHQIYDGSDVSFRSYAIKCLENTGFGYRATQGGETHLPRYAPPVLKPDLDCIRCFRRVCDTMKCHAALTPEQAVSAAESLLKK